MPLATPRTGADYYLELGFTHLVFHLPGRDQRRSIELVGRDVLPRLRDLYPVAGG